MDHLALIQVMGLLGLRIRYWIIIIVIIVVLAAIAFYARGRTA
jgi:hypothetical protein